MVTLILCGKPALTETMAIGDVDLVCFASDFLDINRIFSQQPNGRRQRRRCCFKAGKKKHECLRNNVVVGHSTSGRFRLFLCDSIL